MLNCRRKRKPSTWLHFSQFQRPFSAIVELFRNSRRKYFNCGVFFVWVLLWVVILPLAPSILEGELVSVVLWVVILPLAPSILEGELVSIASWSVILPPAPSILEGELVSVASWCVILSLAPSILEGELDVSYLACCEAIN